MAGRLQNKVAIVTGGGQGLGREVALLFAAEGARMLVADLRESTVQEVVAAIAAAGGVAVSYVGDLTVEANVAAMVERAVSLWGRLDILVNNAGVTQYHKVTETSEAEWDRTLDANLKSQFLGCKHAIPAMERSGGGSIVNIGSISSLVGLPDQGAYGPAKGATLMLTRQVALDYARQNVRVNCVCPGPMDTPMLRDNAAAYPNPQAWLDWLAEQVPLHRIAHPREMAQAALFLASDEASFVTGAIVPVDGGWTIH